MKVGKLRPTGALVRGGPDGIDVYAEELDYAEKRGLQWTEVTMLYACSCPDRSKAIGAKLSFGDAGNVTILGFTDEEP